ncbi:hypothetical protein ACONW8_004079 [Yersinia enterocolitica]
MTELSALAKELGITEEDLEEMDLNPEDLGEDYGNSGEMLYSYYFKVPESTPEHVLKDKGWKVGETVSVSRNTFDEPDHYGEVE